ncbi:Anoctamin-like protein [Intoshia linei]|uniref:Anoctamin n=1 Tax=Intoshia linei TaxID=1819745 RepID=A0A177B821_9BILA|nr:Anoctamin-like protein [Intoshia linei]
MRYKSNSIDGIDMTDDDRTTDGSIADEKHFKFNTPSKNKLRPVRLSICNEILNTTNSGEMLKQKMESNKRIDFILIRKLLDNSTDPGVVEENHKLQEMFESQLINDKIQIQRFKSAKYEFIKLHAPFIVLAKQAQNIKLQMPLKNCKHINNKDNIIVRIEKKFFKTDEEGLLHFLYKHIYHDALVIHDFSYLDPYEREIRQTMRRGPDALNVKKPTKKEKQYDQRLMLDKLWAKPWFKYQPLWRIRNYFGEKIALYFAWAGLLSFSLIIPSIFGLIVFIYGLVMSINQNNITNTSVTNSTSSATNTNSTAFQDIKLALDSSLDTVKESFDNDLTPYYAVIICLWGTVFIELWKRKNALLSYQWDVHSFEENELNRPEFVGLYTKEDPITNTQVWYMPLYRKIMRICASTSILLMMIIVVFICTAAVILYRVIITIDYCKNLSSLNCLILTNILSAVLNAIAIMILGKFNFESGVFGMGNKYQDNCGSKGNCMAMLSIQILVLMIAKPLPKFAKDIVLPLIVGLIKHKRLPFNTSVNITADDTSFIEREFQKPKLDDFTLSEYNEKIILYGFVMIFAASLPIGPFIVLIVIFIDIKVDAKRMLWMFQKPVSNIAQDIGMWQVILQFLNIIGVISNGFLIAYTSDWGYINLKTHTHKLAFVLIFEHVIFGIKFLIDVFIPDVPKHVRLALRKEKYRVSEIVRKFESKGLKRRYTHI